MTRWCVEQGDCLDRLRALPDASVDSVVTDPPYGLAFMGKRWDYDVPSVEVWAECLRVLKPGGHLLAFAGTRTQHRMAVRIEDAGFEIRDMIAWVYGSGFPKSLDVSKAVDARRVEDLQPAADVARWLVDKLAERGLTRRDVDRHFHATNISQQWTTCWTDGAVKPRVPSLEQWNDLKAWLALPDDMDAEVWRLNSRKGQPGDAWAERKVVGTGLGVDTRLQKIAVAASAQGLEHSTKREFKITAPATDAARQWQGWGTALKPALEPITVARKPLAGTVAANVLAHGTGGINVNGCKIGRAVADVLGWSQSGSNAPENRAMSGANYAREAKPDASGRWPANFIHDGSPEATDLLGDAARFFYTAKTSKAERDEGCSGLEQRFAMRYGEKAQGPLPQQTPSKPVAQRNHHPTVKPLDLMRYLCRLVTPPDGLVLDPFTGSGSTGCAAMLEGFRFYGIEREPEYVAIATARIAHWARQADAVQVALPL